MAFNALAFPRSGFNFENYDRNKRLESEGFPSLKARKTGTTIVGIKFKDGVILGADTRATEDTIVSDKNCSKIHYLADNIYCCGAGTAADTEKTTRMVSSNLELHRLNTGRGLRVVTPNRMLSQMLFRYQGHIGAALIVGGVDIEGSHLYSIYPHGSSNELPYVTMGSGSLAAMAVFERGWRDGLPLEEGMQLVRNAVAAGIFNDLGSGSNVDLCIITKDKTNHLRPYDLANIKGQRQGNYRFQIGATSTLKIRKIPLIIEKTMIKRLEVQEDPQTSESMDTV